MISNKSITIFACAWGNLLEPTKKVVEHCKNIFPFFDQTVIVTHISSVLEYNQFMVEKLDSVIDTDFVLTVQLDGYILHPDRWSDDFLNFDYVGAPWPWHGVCGNGGFSLRSKKFIHTASKLHYQPYHPEYSSCPEDFYMCIMAKNHFTYNKCLISDNETGIRFSFEHPIPELEQYTIKTSFGFHGKHNLNDKTIHRRNV